MKITSEFIKRSLVVYTATGSGNASASFTVGLGSFPYLADHGFQDMIVLPGTFFVEMALCAHLECLHASMGTVRNVEFLNPVILSDGDVTLTAQIQRLNDQTVQYTFHESNQGKDGPLSAPPCARLEIECRGDGHESGPVADFNAAAFQKQADDLGETTEFYRRLRENGNQYGPRFQSLRHVWRSGPEVLGRLHVPNDTSESGRHHLHPILTDGAAQLLASFFIDQGRTFILQGFAEIRPLQASFPEEVWIRGYLRPETGANAGARVGDLEAWDDSGRCCLKLTGVKFTYLDRIEPSTRTETPKTNVAVTATFTAEPVEDSLRFWGDYLGMPVKVGFAPYNQVFQELLSPDSLLRRNRTGFNSTLR